VLTVALFPEIPQVLSGWVNEKNRKPPLFSVVHHSGSSRTDADKEVLIEAEAAARLPLRP
jgi:hypothetical protein